MTGINFERLDAAITWAAEHPDEFDMRDWFARNSCGTTACLAGAAALLDGWKPLFTADDGFRAFLVTKDGGLPQDVEQVARRLFGLAVEWHSGIFAADDLAHVIRIRNEWAREAGLPERTWSTS